MQEAIDDVRSYKRFVDGLRAVAILTVVGCHVGVGGFSGGFVGVDIFFVISGHLIIGQIEADVGAGRFSLGDFAVRRVLRILPPFLLVLTICLILSATVFVEYDTRDMAQSFAAAALMLANHYFLGEQGYFHTAAFTHPLLHMWSLSVEEQFYLVAPLAIVAIHAATRGLGPAAGERWRNLATIALALASFVACIALSYGEEHSTAFYLMPTRGWEFIIGGSAARVVPVLRRYSPGAINWLALTGAMLIAVSVVSFDAASHYPTFRAALPVLGTAAIIACGIAAPRNIVARALALSPMVAIGLVSYSWYLWHWPLLTFLRTTNFTDTDIRKALAAAALALVLAALTYFLVERPVRRWRRSANAHGLALAAAGTVSACVLLGFGGYVFLRYEAPRLLPPIAGLEPLRPATAPLPPVVTRGLLLGDSHAAPMWPLLLQEAGRSGAELREAVRYLCPPLLHVHMRTRNGELATECESGLAAIDLSKTDFIIMFARWSYYLDLPWSDPFYPPPHLVPVQPDERVAPIALLRQGLTAFIAKARDAGVKRILLFASVPEFPVQARNCLVRALRLDIDTCSIARSAVDARRAGAMAVLRDIAAQFPEIRLVDPIDLFCIELTCTPYQGRTLYFFDTNHLSEGGVERLYDSFAPDFAWAFGTAPPRPALPPE